MPAQPFIDNWGRCLLAFGCGAGLMLVLMLNGLHPVFLCGAWLVALVGWLLGRATHSS